MKQYDSYKDSGVEWIGKIPSHWEVCRFKDFASLRTDASDDDNKIGLENIEGKTGRFIETSTEFQGNGTAFQEGDIVYGKLRPYLQKVWLATFDGNAVGDFFVFRAKENCRNKLLFYIMISDGFTCMCNGATFGAKMPRVSSDFIRGMHLYLPPMVEQDAMISYLDKKCGEIDKAITTQERRVELLKELKQNIITQAVTRGINPNAPLKDSCVEWIGEVPEHWDIKRIKHCTQIFGRIGFRGYTTQDLVLEGEGPITLSPSNMQGRMNYDSCTYLSWFKYNESPEIQIHNGDVLFVKTGSTYGKSAYVENLPMEATINPQIVVFKDFKDCNSKFFYYLLTTDIVQSQVDNTVIGSTIPTIGQEKIRNYVIPMPPLSEQEEIVSYIESQTARLDTSIEKAEHQIELLQELKQSIITEVVTGKRKVV